MLTSYLLQTCLVLHITGLTMMAGTTLVDSIIYKQFWKQFSLDTTRASGTLEATGKLAVLFAVGFLLLLISGVTLMLLTNGVFAEQLWFKIKMLLVIIVLINGIGIGMRTGLQIRKIVAKENVNTAGLHALKKRLFIFHLSQLVLFLAIFVLGVFKFS